MAQAAPAPAPAPTPVTLTYNPNTRQFTANPPNVTIANDGSVNFIGGFAAGMTCTVCFSPTDVFGTSLQVDGGNQTKSTGTPAKSGITVGYTPTAGTCAQLGKVGNGDTITVTS